MEMETKVFYEFFKNQFVLYAYVVEGGNARRIVLKRGEVAKLKQFSLMDTQGTGRLFYE
jgi:hypothetical protein